MITFWNRKEVYLGYSMSECDEIRTILSDQHIHYTYKVVNPFASDGRKERGSFGGNADRGDMYYIYVHKKNYEWACKVLRERQ